MARLTIEIPPGLRRDDRAATDRNAMSRVDGRYRGGDVDAATEAFVDWVDCWAGA